MGPKKNSVQECKQIEVNRPPPVKIMYVTLTYYLILLFYRLYYLIYTPLPLWIVHDVATPPRFVTPNVQIYPIQTLFRACSVTNGAILAEPEPRAIHILEVLACCLLALWQEGCSNLILFSAWF